MPEYNRRFYLMSFLKVFSLNQNHSIHSNKNGANIRLQILPNRSPELYNIKGQNRNTDMNIH